MCVGSFIWVCVGCSVCVLVWFECILLWDVFGVFEWVLGCFGCVLTVMSVWVSFAGSWRCFECILDVFSVFELCWMSFVGISECFECLGCFQHDLGVWVSFMDILRWCGVFWASFWMNNMCFLCFWVSFVGTFGCYGVFWVYLDVKHVLGVIGWVLLYLGVFWVWFGWVLLYLGCFVCSTRIITEGAGPMEF